MSKKKYEKPLAIDAPFEETLERFARVDPSEMAEKPVTVVEYEGMSGQFLIFGESDGPQVQLRIDKEMPWFTYGQMAEIFGVDESVAIRHVQNFIDDGE